MVKYRSELLEVYSPPLGAQNTAMSHVGDLLERLLQLLEDHGNAKLNVYLDGNILEHIEKKLPEMIETLVSLHKAGRIEVLGGLFYDPPLHLLSSRDLLLHWDLSRAFWKDKGLNPLYGLRIRGPLSGFLWSKIFAIEPQYLILDTRNTREIPLVRNSEHSFFFARENTRETSSDPTGHLAKTGSPLANLIASAPARAPAAFLNQFSILRHTFCVGKDNFSSLASSPLIEELESHFAESTKFMTFKEAHALLAALPVLNASTDEILDDAFRNDEADLRVPSVDLIERLERLGLRKDRLAAYIGKSDVNPRARTHLLAAERLYLRAENTSSLLKTQPPSVVELRAKAQAISLIIEADVELDDVRHHGTNPVNGWIELEDREEGKDGDPVGSINCFFARFGFDTSLGGVLKTFEYKPRRVDLCSIFSRGKNRGSFTACLLDSLPQVASATSLDALDANLAAAAMQKSSARITRKMSDVLGIRFEHCLSKAGRSDPDIIISKNFLIKAGMGAHKPDSTTGISCEYWIEGRIPMRPDDYLAMEFNLMLPCSRLSELIASPLSSVGGVAPLLVDLEEKASLISSPTVPGGLHGIRFACQKANVTLDVRSAKPLTHILVRKHDPGAERDTGYYWGTNLVFIQSARAVFEDDRANTIFISI